MYTALKAAVNENRAALLRAWFPAKVAEMEAVAEFDLVR
jgi:hypothetical protein